MPCKVYTQLLGILDIFTQVWEVARVIREQRQLNKQRKELWAAHLAAAVDRRPFHLVAQPDGTVSLCRPLEKDVYERGGPAAPQEYYSGQDTSGLFLHAPEKLPANAGRERRVEQTSGSADPITSLFAATYPGASSEAAAKESIHSIRLPKGS